MGFKTFKELKTPLEDLDTKQGYRRLKLILKWVACTLLLYVLKFADVLLGWIPAYTLVKVLFVCFILSDKSLAVKLLWKFETFLEYFEQTADKYFGGFKWALSKAFVPVGVFAMDKLVFISAGASREDLRRIEHHCQNLLEEIKAVKSKKFSNKRFRSTIALDSTYRLKAARSVEITPDTPSLKVSPHEPAPRILNQTKWTVKVQMQLRKTKQMDPARFFPHTIWYKPKTKELFWQAQGDDMVSREPLKELEIQNKTGMIAQAVLKNTGTTKVIKFLDRTSFQEWTEKVIANLSLN